MNFHAKGQQYLGDDLFFDHLASHLVHMLVVERDLHRFKFDRIVIHNLGNHGCPCEFNDKLGGALNGIDGDVRVAATLIAEGGIGLEAVTLGCLADGDRVEIGTFQEQAGGIVRDARLETAIDASDAHALLFIADHQVVSAQFDLVSI